MLAVPVVPVVLVVLAGPVVLVVLVVLAGPVLSWRCCPCWPLPGAGAGAGAGAARAGHAGAELAVLAGPTW